MGEIFTEVKTYVVDYRCDECGKGVMRFGLRILPTYPSQYPHKCDTCGHQQIFYDAYPRTVVK